MMAFEGIRSTLTETVNVSESGLLLKLLDDNVISRRESQFVEVLAQVLRDFCYVSLIFYIVLHAYLLCFCLLVIAARVYSLFFVTTKMTKLLNRSLLVNLAMKYVPLRMSVFLRLYGLCTKHFSHVVSLIQNVFLVQWFLKGYESILFCCE